MAEKHIYRRSQSSEQISIYFGTKLLFLYLLLNVTSLQCAVANDIESDHNSNSNIKQRRVLTQQSGRQSDASSTNCVLNSYGIYGSIDTSNTATINEIYNIEYLYQVSVTIGTTDTQLSSDIILPIDSVITTAILPSFFPNCNTNRFLQQAVNTASSGANITAISSTPVDTYVPTGLICPKIIANTDCYVVQGLSTVIGTGERDDEYVQATFQLALQSALQNNAIVPLLSSTTNIVIDVSALTDSLEIPPPISVPIQSQAPIPSPSPTTTRPVALPVAVPTPIATLTFAPIPDSVSILDPTLSPNSEQPSSYPTTVPINTNSTTNNTLVPFVAPVPNTDDDANREQQSTSKDGLKWWAWLLIILAIILVAFCGYGAYLNQRDGTTNTGRRGEPQDVGTGAGSSRIGMLTSNPKVNVQAIKRKNSTRKGNSKGTRDTEDDDDDDDEEVPYEPPVGMDQYVPPPTMALSNNSISNASADNIFSTTPENDDDFATNGLPTIPFFTTNDVSDMPTPAFINNNDLDDETDEDEDETNMDNGEGDEEIEYENDGYGDEDGDYTEEGDDDEEEVEEEQHGYTNQHEDGEVFEDEESYYEEEEDEDDEGDTYGDGSYPPHNNGPGGGGNNNNNAWGGEHSSPPSFGGLY